MNPIADQPQRIDRLTPLSEALAWIDRTATPVPPRRVPLARAVTRILAEPVVVAVTKPARDLSWRDGWGVRSEETIDAGSYAPAILSRSPVRLDLGDDLPDGVDAVAPVDGVDAADGTALAVVAHGEGVLAAGTDARAGETVKTEGASLRLTDIAALSALGITEVSVREPQIGIVPMRRDAIADAIVSFLVGAVAAAGGSAKSVGSLEMCVDAPLDAIVVVGGTGSGRDDLSVRRVEATGNVHIHGVGLTPGETAALATIGERPTLLVPARLDAAFSVWLTLGLRIMARLCDGPRGGTNMAATLKSKIASTLGFAELVLLTRNPDGVTPVATGHLPLATLAASDGFVLVPPDSEGFPAGSVIDMKVMP